MDGMNVSDYVDPDIELKLRELEEEEAHQLAETEAVNMGGRRDDNIDLDKEEEADVQEIRDRDRTTRNVGMKNK